MGSAGVSKDLFYDAAMLIISRRSGTDITFLDRRQDMELWVGETYTMYIHVKYLMY